MELNHHSLYSHNRIFSIFALFVIAFIGLVLFSGLTKISAQPSTDWIAECERRNLLYDCQCECNEPGVKYMCSEVSSSCSYNRYDPNECVEQTSTQGFTIFPNFGNGVIVLLDSGTLDSEATIRNIIYLLGLIVGGIALLITGLGLFKVANSGGQEDQIEEGKTQIKNSLLGVAIVVFGVIVGLLLVNILGFGEAATPQLKDNCNPPTVTEEGLRCLFDSSVDCFN